MSRKDFKYGISKTSILVHGFTNNQKPDDRTAFVGSIVKIEGTLGNGNVVVRFLESASLRFEDSKYYGKQLDFIPVAEKLWPLLLAMPSLMERVSVAANSELCDTLVNLTINSKVEVLHNKIYYSAVVRYIGPVDTMGSGYFLGLELVNRTQITKCDGSYADKQYFSALPGTALFVSIEKIRPVPHYLSTNPKRYTNFSPYDSYSQPDSGEMRNPTSSSKEGIIKTAEISQIEKPRSSTQKVSFSPKLDNEMDLIELIGGSWPAADLNYKPSNSEIPSTSTQNLGTNTITSNKLTRNKSMNPMSHLINQKKVMRNQPRNELINLSSNSSGSSTLAGSPPAALSTSIEDDVSEDRITNTTYDTPNDSSTNLSVGTLVEVITDISDPLYGVIRWVGNNGLAGVELEEDHEHLPLVLTDGTHNGNRYFSCANGRALFVPIKQCQKDSRFDDVPQKDVDDMNSSKMFGQVDSPIVPGSVPPLSMPTEEDVLAVCGKYRGIQGHHNSCYLDATLFAMFTYTGVFDSLLFRPRASNDISHYEEVQKVLREEIVNPLRQNLYVRADRVMKLRTLLEELSSVSGLTSEEKDPEEFLNSLLAQILKAEPFLKLSSGQEAFHYQLFVEKDEGLALPSVQQLFEQSFLSSDIKLKEVPSCLIIQMPRFGKSFKMYPRILPSQLLDVTDIIENSPRQCTVCGKLAQYECRDCFGQCSVGLESTAFCAVCLETAHTHVKRSSHSPRPLTVPHDFAIIAEHCPPPRLYMELFAVVCIETSHYVAFVKCGSGHEAPWCFFDSMADRKGEQNGYNIPEMVACPDVSTWLSDDGAESRKLHETHPHDKQLPEHARRLLCDAYICMYQSPDVMMYR